VTHVLILGGTAEARALADTLTQDGIRVTSTLAGAVANPRLPAGAVRVGGFGGPLNLARWITTEAITAVVDATHPFAEHISESALAATRTAGIPLLRLQRPGWTARDGDDWRWVADLDEAAAAITGLGTRVFLTTGRQGLPSFAGLADPFFLIRCVDPPQTALPPRSEILLDRGPYTLAGELALIEAHRLDVVVTKDSGGQLTVAKLDAARERALPVIVVRRPPAVAADVVPDVAAAAAWVARQAG
jgi:precorrin-6A/cobalt-precorrin-6A reductase